MDDILNFVNYLEYIEIDIGDDDNYIPRRYLRNIDYPFELYSDDQFFKRYLPFSKQNCTWTFVAISKYFLQE